MALKASTANERNRGAGKTQKILYTQSGQAYQREKECVPEVKKTALEARSEALRLLACGQTAKAGKAATKALDSRYIDDMEQRRELSSIEDRFNPNFEKNRKKRSHKKSKNKMRTFDMGAK